ncbi:class I SAM-dependent methyltransferase [Sulfurirhabdus autotrophica]|uniref:Methyltransferase family protein n=1 Tax=Sulfurirhabdus autotrophica TaxID=1706046 RepID=A0A4R3Y1Y8_9PROT|nr:class I SAM-dependent methyltransferase [Sulfurirhabdus autotrophica]TCV84264.1 methyltransferase family protein [Sulfurirhabdus autotrophica]
MDKKQDFSLRSDTAELRNLILGMRAAYARGENAMEFARQTAGAGGNSLVSTLLAYDLQAGSYISEARANPEANALWCAQLAGILDPFITDQSSMLEVGCGEATTLTGVLRHLRTIPQHALGFDISWSRCAEGLGWLLEKEVNARLFVADLFEIPLEDGSVDVIYTSHSLEPNGGREEEAIRELMRVARRAVVLIEPIYELANMAAQSRMRHHGYVQSLKETAERLGANVTDYRLLDHINNPLNPSGLVLIEKSEIIKAVGGAPAWRCPLTHIPMSDLGDVFVGEQSGLAYPVLREIPLLRMEHGVIASKIHGSTKKK